MLDQPDNGSRPSVGEVDPLLDRLALLAKINELNAQLVQADLDLAVLRNQVRRARSILE